MNSNGLLFFETVELFLGFLTPQRFSKDFFFLFLDCKCIQKDGERGERDRRDGLCGRKEKEQEGWKYWKSSINP